MLVPRYYQFEAIQAVFDYLTRYDGNPIVAMPTGTGKSVVIAELLRQMFAAYPALRVVMATHVKELIEQNADELQGLWPMAPLGIFSAGLGKKEVRPITFAGIKSIVNVPEQLGHIDFLIIDECHLLSPADDSSYQILIAALKKINPFMRVIGLSATPYRLGQGLLTHPVWREDTWMPAIFTEICYDITQREKFNQLIDEGFLCTLTPKKTDTVIDVSQVTIRGGEFAKEELETAVDKDEITYSAIREMIILGENRKSWLVFGTGKRHCQHITQMLKQCGVSAVCVHDKTPAGERRESVKAFKNFQVRALVNNIIYSVGFNHKAVDLIGDLAPTNSTSRHVQKYGRGARPYPDKQDCLVLDFAGNTARLGPINDPVIPKARKPGERSDDSIGAPTKICPNCSSYVATSLRWCKCGYEFPYVRPDINATADTLEIVATTGARFIELAVTSTDYAVHLSKNEKPNSLRVTYYCGRIQSFCEWICLEHDGYAGKRARDWWRERTEQDEAPKTIEEAMGKLSHLQTVTHIRIWTNSNPPNKITAYDYSGTQWGKVSKTFP